MLRIETDREPRAGSVGAGSSSAYVGRSQPRVEDRSLLDGSGCYGADVRREGELHARIVRSDVAHGRLAGIDAEAARAREGVAAVFAADDLPDRRIQIRLFPGPDAERALQAPLAAQRVRYVGEPVAVVVAEDPYVAEDAAGEVTLDVEPIDPVLEVREALAGDAARLHQGVAGNLLDGETVSHGERVEALFERAAVVVRKRMRVHRHGAVPMEPRVLVAEHDPVSGRLTVWGAAKVKHYNRRALAAMLGMDEGAIRLVEGDVGGGFGARGEFYPEDFLIPWLAIQLGRPVTWVEDRRENLVALNHSREGEWEVEFAAAADGTLLGFRSRAWFNTGAYVRTHGSLLLPRVMTSHLSGPYRWQGFEAEAAGVLTNKTPAGTYRGPGLYESAYVRERMIDLLAGELEIDPVELRRRNLVGTADLPFDVGVPDIESRQPKRFEDGDFPRTFEAAVELAGYEGMRAEVAERRRRGERVGIGVSTFHEMPNQGPFERARVTVEPDGTFTAHVGVASVGQGVATVLAQLAADLLEVPIERVRVSYHDTDVAPEGLGAFASRATVFGGNAIAGAVRELLARARERAGERLGVPPEQVEVSGGLARAGGNGEARQLPLAELGELEGPFTYEPSAGADILMGANVVLARIDPDTGEVALLRYVISYEVGRVINPLTLDGQVVGAAAQGVGGVLLEEFAYSPDGQPLSTSFMDYAMPAATEIPDFDVVLLELGEEEGDDPLAGAKGAGEGGIVGVAGAVANAVADAIGERGRELTDLPITPEAVQRLGAGPRAGK
jgi:carbon-monoxide dehydrogenase large subunit